MQVLRKADQWRLIVVLCPVMWHHQLLFLAVTLICNLA